MNITSVPSGMETMAYNTLQAQPLKRCVVRLLKDKLSIMNKIDPFIEKLQLAYENDNTVKALIKSTPLTDFFHSLISERVKEIRYKRTKQFFSELGDGEVELDEGTIESEDFTYAFFQCYKYAINSRRSEKVQLFARLLKVGIRKGLEDNYDEFEEYSKNLDQLSYREITVLHIVSEIYKKFQPPPKDTSDYIDWLNRYQDELINEIASQCDIRPELIPSTIESISKTGFLRRASGTPDRGEGGYSMKTLSIISERQIYEPTPYFIQLRDYLKT